MSVHPDHEELVELLNRFEVDCLLIGGIAVSLHARPRFTEDIDFFFRPTVENLHRLETAVSAFFGRQVTIPRRYLTAEDEVFAIGAKPYKADFLFHIPGVDTFDEPWQDAKTMAFGKTTIRVMSPQWLIRNKRACARHKDLADAEVLEAALALEKESGSQD